jgi:hypothetical protein
MDEPITAKQILERLSPYKLDSVTFEMPDGLPVIAAYIDIDRKGGPVIILSDGESEAVDGFPFDRLHASKPPA